LDTCYFSFLEDAKNDENTLQGHKDLIENLELMSDKKWYVFGDSILNWSGNPAQLY